MQYLINGIGGIGKTEICRKLFWKCADEELLDIKYVGWLTFRDDLLSTFAGKLNEVSHEGIDNEEYMNRAEQYLNEAGRKLLLFIDNANKITDEEIKRLSKMSCRIVLTSRQHNMERLKPIEITELTYEECRKIYRYHSKDTTTPDETLDEIIRLANRHTLAVELLAKTQASNWKSADSLLANLIEKGFQLPEMATPVKYIHMNKMSEKEQKFIEHMSIIFDMADIQGESLRILKLFSLLAPDSILIDTAKEWMDIKNMNTVNELNNRGWLRKEEQKQKNEELKISIHPVIAAVIQHQHPVDFDSGKQLVEHLNESLYLNNMMIFTDKLPFIPHAQSVLNVYNQQEDEQMAILRNHIASIYDRQGNYQKAMDLLKKALIINEKVFGPEHPSTATSYNNIAVVYYSQGDYPEALTWYQKALAIREKVLGKEHPSTATTYNNIAVVYDSQGDYPEALTWYQKALAIREKVLGKEHPDTAITYGNIAGVYDSQGDYPKALDFLKKTFLAFEKKLGPDHPNTKFVKERIEHIENS